MAEDDGLLLKHRKCTCHSLNLISTVDANHTNRLSRMCQSQHSPRIRLSGIRLQGPLGTASTIQQDGTFDL